MRRWWLSFAGETEFLGACVVRAESSKAAHQLATRLGLNPGGSVMILPLPEGEDLDVPEDVLMSAEFIKSRGLGGPKPAAMDRAAIDRIAGRILGDA